MQESMSLKYERFVPLPSHLGSFQESKARIWHRIQAQILKPLRSSRPA